MAAIENLVKQTTVGAGTGALTLSALLGYLTFHLVWGSGSITDVFFYFIIDTTNDAWEYGTGHISITGALIRDTVIASSNSDELVDFGSGTKTVACDLPAEFQKRIGYIGVSNDYDIKPTDETIALISGNGTFTFPDATELKPGKEFFIKNSGTGTLSWNTTADQTVDGLTSGSMTAQYDGKVVQSNGANYIVKA